MTTTSTDHLQLAKDLKEAIEPDRVVTDPFKTITWGADASFYRMQPKVVVTVQSISDVKSVLAKCRKHRAPVTFRAAGTSLSGQAVTDSVLARLGDGWSQVRVNRDASKVTLGPGVIGARANAVLQPFGRKLGPDPASIGAAMIGGIAANNASGMCCGTDQNSYRTLDSMKIVFVDGTVLDTGDGNSIARFRKSHRHLAEGLAALRTETLSDGALTEKIRRKFAIKNTTGYSLNALVDFEDPIDILQHLMIGSEGTLGFISEITYRTVPDPKFKAATLAFFENPPAAAAAVIGLRDLTVAAIELIDRAGIRTAEGKPNMPSFLSELGPEATALLIEVQAESQEKIDCRVSKVSGVLKGFETVRPAEFSQDAGVCAGYWAVRKGLFPAVGALRDTGTTVIIEDVAFPVENLAKGVTDLQALFARHNYADAILFGHARAGNLHVVFSQDFRSPQEVERYGRFMQELSELVVNYDGSLKAEHGTGRNVAPFVELEWGREAFALMRKIKDLFDPEGLLNPGVIINDDPEAHLKHLKDIPAAHPIVDTCTECGFCESHCPSNRLTTSPRQRTVAYRAIQNPDTDKTTQAALKNRFSYEALDTCAACGLCASVCPVQIDTGAFVKTQRTTQQTPTTEAWASWVANHFGTVTDATGLGLRAGTLAKALFGTSVTQAMSTAAGSLSAGAVPQWTQEVPDGYRFRPSRKNGAAAEAVETMVYLPSCVSRTMRPVAETGYHEPLPVVVERLALRAGVHLVYPSALKDLCCGQPFDSKGLKDQATKKAQEALKAVREAGEGPVKVLSDTSPCSYRLRTLQEAGVEVVDLVEFLHDRVVPNLDLTKTQTKLAVHATCSLRKMGLTGKLQNLARACAEDIAVPADVECCGFAGDRGFSFPELNAHALRYLKDEIEGSEAGCSSSLTCEIGLARHSGLPYRSIAYFIDEATETKPVNE